MTAINKPSMLPGSRREFREFIERMASVRQDKNASSPPILELPGHGNLAFLLYPAFPKHLDQRSSDKLYPFLFDCALLKWASQLFLNNRHLQFTLSFLKRLFQQNSPSASGPRIESFVFRATILPTILCRRILSGCFHSLVRQTRTDERVARNE